MVTRERDRNGDVQTYLFGVPVPTIASTILILLALATYATPIYVGTTYLNNLYELSKRNQERTQELREYIVEHVNPAKDAALRSEVERIRNVQNQVLAGATIPQTTARDRLTAVASELEAMRRRYDALEQQVQQMSRAVDQHTVRFEQLLPTRK